jgi:hypothetical protein
MRLIDSIPIYKSVYMFHRYEIEVGLQQVSHG